MRSLALLLCLLIAFLLDQSFGSFLSSGRAAKLRDDSRPEDDPFPTTSDALKKLLADRVPDENAEPLIAILSQPMYHSLPNVSFIAASYVQYVESAGARAVPIVFNDDIAEIRKRFYEVSGIIFPGGTVGLDASMAEQYDDVVHMLFDMAKNETNRSDVIALHGFCMGFQMMMRFSASVGDDVLSKGFDSSDQPNELMWTTSADDSRIVGDNPIDKTSNHNQNSNYLRLRMSQLPPIVLENHHEGVDLETFLEDDGLLNFWNLISVSRDRVGRQYVSTVEAKDYLFSGTQWHPEKNSYEWKSQKIPHQLDAIAVTQFMANRFVNQARFSRHRPANLKRLNDLVIWNNPPVYHSPLVRDFELIFVYGPHEPELLYKLTKNPPAHVLRTFNRMFPVEEI